MLCQPCAALDGGVLQQLSSLGPEQAIQPSPYVLPVRSHPPVWVIYGGELWSRVRALLTAEALQIRLPYCKHKSGRRPGGNTHTLSTLGRTSQEDKPSCKRKSWLEMSHACTQRGLRTPSLSQRQDGPRPPAAPSLLFPCSSHAGMEQLSLPAPPRSFPRQGDPISPQHQHSTAQLRHGDTIAETQIGSAGATWNAVAPAERCQSQQDWVQQQPG